MVRARMPTKDYWDVVFLLVCSIPAGYYVHIQISSFISNEDVVSISYRSFNQEARDEHPQYTLCFMNPNGLDLDVPFERIVQKLPKNHTFRGHWLKRIITSLPLTFQDSNTICYTKNVSFPRNIRLKRDYIYLNVTFLSDTFTYLHVFVHKRNQLLRSMKRPKQSISNDRFKEGTYYVLDIIEVEVLRRREDSNKPCNDSLTDEDAYALDILMQKYQCVPKYWRKLSSTMKKGKTLPTCSNKQYVKLRRAFNRDLMFRFGTTHELYLPPCQTMRTFVGVMKGGKNDSDAFKILFEYQQDSYKEIVDKRGFTSQDLLGNVGGFVGK